MVTLCVASCFLIFNVVSVSSNYVMGYLAIVILGGYIGISLLKVVLKTVRQMYKRIRFRVYKRRYLKKRSKM